MTPGSASLGWRGQLERVDPNGVVEGWCVSADRPEQPVEVVVRCDGVAIAAARCQSLRPDLAAYGVGGLRCGFWLELPREQRPAGVEATISLHEAGSGQRIGQVLSVIWPDAGGMNPLALDAPALAGNLDGVSPDGLVTGWCRDPMRPDVRVTLAILVDGRQAGVARAALFRPDLLAAGIGDGGCGFSFPLPWSALEGRGQVSVSVRDCASTRLLADPVVLRLGPLSATEDRVAELERQIRLLSAGIAGLSAELDRRDSAGPTQAMFATLGALFGELSGGGDAAGGLDRRAAGLSVQHAQDRLRVRHAPITLAIAAVTQAVIVIPAGRDFGQLYRCIEALHVDGVDRRADIVVLDDGSGPAEIALLAALIGNIRLMRVDALHTQAAALADLAGAGRAGLLVYLSAKLQPLGGWLDAMMASFEQQPEAALVGLRVVGRDGLLRHCGYGSDPHGVLQALGLLEDADHPAWSALREVEAVAALGFAVRSAAFLGCGGLRAAASPGEAVWDLCGRLRAAGHVLLVQPQAQAWCDDAADFSADAADLQRAGRLTHWVRLPQPLGQALVIDSAVPRPDRDAGSLAMLEQLLVLRRLGYHVRFAATDGIAADTPGALHMERLGIELVRAPGPASINAFLVKHGAELDVVQVWRHRNASLFLDRVRALAPRARFIFAPADLHHLREDRQGRLAGAGPTLEGVADSRAAEFDCVRAADATIVHSDAEMALLSREVGPDRLRLLRWIARPSPAARGFGERNGIGFIGHFRHSPNEDGLRWFLAEIMPRLRSIRPGLMLHVGGHDLPDDLTAMAGPDIVVHGGVEDLAGFFAGLRLSVAPLRYGAGFKGKVATSLSFGVPVVGTGIAAEGTGLADGDGITIANGGQAFARAVVLLHDSEAQWHAQSSRALERCRALYAPEAALEVYRSLLCDNRLPDTAKRA